MRDISLQLQPGEAVGVFGPNGSGKTTLIRAAGTLLRIDQGRLFVLGDDATARRLGEARRSIGLIGHEPALIPELTLAENLAHFARLADIAASRIPKALEVVGLSGAADRRVDASSFGMKRRVEIAHALLTRPRLLLLDEAGSGLDGAARDVLAALVQSVCDRNGGCIVVSHDPGHLADLCSHTMALSGGRLEPTA